MIQAFAEGGVFMFVVLFFGIAVLAMAILQLAAARRVDLSPLSWGLLVALVLSGLLGSVLGVAEGFGAMAAAAPEHRAAMMAMAISIAVNTTALALILALPLSIFLGVASFVSRRAQLRRLAARLRAGEEVDR